MMYTPPTRRIILSRECDPYLGFAERKLEELRRRRRALGLPALKKCILVNGVNILIVASAAADRIIMWAGTAFPHILFSSNEAAWAYNYLSDTLTLVDQTFSGELNPIFDGRCQYGTEAHSTFDGKVWTHGEATGTGEYVGGVGGFETAIFSDGSILSGQQQGEAYPLATGEHYRDLSFADYYAVNLPISPEDTDWNQFDTVAVYQRFLSNAAGFETYRWAPSFFFAEEQNGLYVTGWHYGKFGVWSEGDNFTALVADPIAGRAQLLGFMEVRSPEVSQWRFGYCEALTELNIDPSAAAFAPQLPVLSFFLADNPPTDDGEMWFNWQSFELLSNAAMRGGTKPTGTDRAFAIYNPYGDGSLPDKVHLWAFSGWADLDATPPQMVDTVGVAIIKGQDARFYRYKGFLQDICLTTQYHSHSLSPDGTTLAIFESADGDATITGVKVFDLYGAKADPQKNDTLKPKTPDLYTSGGFTLLRERNFDVGAVTACIIPHRLTDFEPETNIDAAVSTIEYPSGLHYPAMGSLHWPRDGVGTLTIYKLVVRDGIYGHAGRSLDACFNSTIIIDDPNNPPAADKLVTRWAENNTTTGVDLYYGYVRGAFVGDHPNMRFIGEGNGDIRTVTLPGEFQLSIVYDASKGGYVLAYEDNVGAVSIMGDCIGEDGVLLGLSECYDNDPCSDRFYQQAFTATSNCNQTALATRESEPILDLEISGTDAPVVGSTYSASGGIPPYTFSISCGGINSTTGVVTSLTGCCGSGTVSVTDSCGDVASLEVRFATGRWVTKESWGNTSGIYSSRNFTDYVGALCTPTSRDLYALCGSPSIPSPVIIGKLRHSTTAVCAITCDGEVDPYVNSTINNGTGCPTGVRHTTTSGWVDVQPPYWPSCSYSSGPCTWDDDGNPDTPNAERPAVCVQLRPGRYVIEEWVCC